MKKKVPAAIINYEKNDLTYHGHTIDGVTVLDSTPVQQITLHVADVSSVSHRFLPERLEIILEFMSQMLNQ